MPAAEKQYAGADLPFLKSGTQQPRRLARRALGNPHWRDDSKGTTVQRTVKSSSLSHWPRQMATIGHSLPHAEPEDGGSAVRGCFGDIRAVSSYTVEITLPS